MPETLNPYVYGYDNPLAYPDPNGDCPICLAGAVYLLKNAAQSATFSAGEYYLTHRADKGGIDWVDFTRTVGYDAVTGSINPLGGAGKAGRIMKFADEARDAGRVADDIWIGSKIQRQMGKRGWTDTEVEDTITNPARTISTRDTRHLPGGGRMDDPATAYYRSDGSYVVRNNKTGDIVQVSNEPNPVAPACREGGGDGRNGRSRTGAQIDGAPRPCVPQGFICI
ncbi:hypothetical protein GBA63_09365 [Rubrobacter tropicus]|uniref:Colicin E5 ribonuclease domain-containing protein n=2 Tax=Rubrobacter tropicus TaxID=2653851 RepID=A0A6G8QF44_9ACTN|nr:hypothetical protein GBA63_09365 [Rubrobacter tropicus]